MRTKRIEASRLEAPALRGMVVRPDWVMVVRKDPVTAASGLAGEAGEALGEALEEGEAARATATMRRITARTDFIL